LKNFLDPEKRRSHFYIIGKTGMGKTTLLEHLVFFDIESDNGLGVIDPHGDLIEKILKLIPRKRVNEVCYFNPQDQEYPFSFNPLTLKGIEEKDKPIIVSGIISIFKKLWPEFWGPRSEHIFRNLLLGLLEKENPSFLEISFILGDRDFRRKWAKKIKDSAVKFFWQKEFENLPEKLQQEAVAPLQNKIGQLLTNPLIRNIISQQKRKIDLREIIDNKKILLVNLAKGAIGEDVSSLLGSMLIILLQLEVMKRINQPEEERQDFTLYIDEFQNFATQSFADILSEARKFHLSLVLSHQYLGQLDENLRKAVFGNVGTKVFFKVGGEDNEILQKEFSLFKPSLINLEKHTMITLFSGHESDKPYPFPCFPPLRINRRQKEKIIKVSRERYCQPKEKVEERIKRFYNLNLDKNQRFSTMKLYGNSKYSKNL